MIKQNDTKIIKTRREKKRKGAIESVGEPHFKILPLFLLQSNKMEDMEEGRL